MTAGEYYIGPRRGEDAKHRVSTIVFRKNLISIRQKHRKSSIFYPLTSQSPINPMYEVA